MRVSVIHNTSLYKLTATLLIGVLVLLVPQIQFSELYQHVQNSHAFSFLYGMIACIIILILLSLIYGKKTQLRINLLDIFLAVYALMIGINFLLKPAEDLQILVFTALCIIYIILRIFNKNSSILLFVILLSAIIQASIGSLQLYGFANSNHGLFKLTGSFFNPGPYAGYLACIFPVALSVYLFKPRFEDANNWLISIWCKNLYNLLPVYLKAKSNLKIKNRETENRNIIYYLFYYTSIICLILTLLVLPASRSRAAILAVFISSMYLLLIRYKKEIKNLIVRHLNSTIKKIAFLVATIILPASMLLGAYLLKKDSADGRILIWKLGLEMIKDKPIIGHGIGGFVANYMEYQANYFKSNLNIQDTMVADNVIYPFNEFLKIFIENGLIGLLLILFILGTAFFGKAPPENRPEHIQLAVKAGLLSILIFAQFSYPSEIVPIKIILVLFLAIIASYQKPILLSILTGNNQTGIQVLKYTFLLFILLSTYPFFQYINQQYCAYKSWKDASDIYRAGAYTECLDDFEQAYPFLKQNGDFLVQYGKALEMAEKYDSSIIILNQAKGYLNNTILYTTQGNNCKALAKPKEAEQAYKEAWYMVPSRFYPKYLLAKLYQETGQMNKAKAIAQEILNKEVKIESTAIEEIKEEMQKLINGKEADNSPLQY